MHADAKQTEFCTYLSAILLVGLLLNTFFGLWWADSLAALVMVPIIAKEEREDCRVKPVRNAARMITSSKGRRISLGRPVFGGRRLKEQEGVQRVRCLRTGRDSRIRAPRSVREFVANLFLEPRHGRRTGGVGVVNEHRCLEIPGGKHLAMCPK